MENEEIINRLVSTANDLKSLPAVYNLLLEAADRLERLESYQDPTARGDDIADDLRAWYEANRETWFDRHWPFGINRKHGSAIADNFMIGLIEAVHKAESKYPR